MKSAKLILILAIGLGCAILFFNISGCCPCFIKHDQSSASKTKICENNLKNIEIAKHLWAVDHQKNDDTIPTWNDLLSTASPGPYLSQMPKCPDGGTYTLNAVNQNPTCNIPGHSLK
ncbi:MAG: hypothetical protein ACE14V_08830 [bacterium]